jgi:hypothetical protein
MLYLRAMKLNMSCEPKPEFLLNSSVWARERPGWTFAFQLYLVFMYEAARNVCCPFLQRHVYIVLLQRGILKRSLKQTMRQYGLYSSSWKLLSVNVFPMVTFVFSMSGQRCSLLMKFAAKTGSAFHILFCPTIRTLRNLPLDHTSVIESRLIATLGLNYVMQQHSAVSHTVTNMALKQ